MWGQVSAIARSVRKPSGAALRPPVALEMRLLSKKCSQPATHLVIRFAICVAPRALC